MIKLARFMLPRVALRLAAPALALGALAACGGGDETAPLPAATIPWPYAPYEPPPVATPLADTVFVQEQNHTSNELEPGVGALVAVLVPPGSATGLELPVQVTPRGVVTHPGGGAAAIVPIEAGDADLVGAAFAGDTLALVGPGAVYLFDAGAGTLARHAAPAGTVLLGLASGATQAYLRTDHGLGLVRGPAPGQLDWPTSAPGDEPVDAALEAASALYLASPSGLAQYPLPISLPLGAPSATFAPADGLATGTVTALVADVTLPAPLDLVVLGTSGVQGLLFPGGAPSAPPVPEFAPTRVPLGAATGAARAADGGFVVATAEGAYRMLERGDGPEWRVYGAERWLPSEAVRAVATDPAVATGPIYFATGAGLATATAAPVTLEQKLASFVERIVLRHDRDGAVADSRLSVPGDLSTSIPYDSDNDGGWTSYWLLSECFRFRATGDLEAKAHFDRSLERMLSLRTLTGTDWFVARAVIRIEGCVLDDCANPDDGEWFLSPDGAWWVKGDTSNDEVTSHMFMLGHAYDLCADADQQAAIRAHVAGIVGGLLDHGYDLVDVDGLPTSYGQFDPFYVNESIPGQLQDGGRRSAQLLAALTLAHYLTGDERFVDAKRDLIATHHYADNAVHESEYPIRAGSGDGDELAMQAFFVLLRYEPEAALRDLWLEGWRRTYGNLRLQQGAWWDLVNAVVGGDAPDLANAGRWLRLAPMDMIRWTMHNSQRRDLVPGPAYYGDDARMRSDGRILPYDERPNDRWNTDQFKADGGLGAGLEMDGADVLAPYWMGRYYAFIVPAP
ncbi:MAG: hypothetical protein HY908_34425 [Myxococcales bacterium]|nr:hypothetical protein [Myxococcales bacterium]